LFVVRKDSSALFVLVKSVTEDKVLAEIEHYKPRVLKTSLSNEAEGCAERAVAILAPQLSSNRKGLLAWHNRRVATKRSTLSLLSSLAR
jgi:hypothetical protein